jgi:hypothetical protein
MSYTKVTGISMARELVKHNAQRFTMARQRYIGVAGQYCQDVPQTILFAHITRVNATFDMAPVAPAAQDNPLIANTVGFLRLPITYLKDVGLTAYMVNDPETCSWAWLKAFNEDSKFLHKTYPDLFPTANEDFWRCAYARTALGDVLFGYLWSESEITSLHASNVWNHILEVLETRTKAIGNLTVAQMKKYVFFEFEYVFQLAKKYGTVQSTGFGKEPVPSPRVMSFLK